MDIDSICRLNRLRDKREKRNGIDVVVEKGIIDEMIKQSYYYREFKDELGIDYQKKILSGTYINNSKEKDVWSEYFRLCEKKYCDGWVIKKNDYQAKKSEGRLLAIEYLIKLANGELNEKMKNNFNFEINSIDDFKVLLKNDELSEKVRKYIVSIIKMKPYSLAREGLHDEYVTISKQVNNERVYTHKNIEKLSFDMKITDEGSETTLLDLLEFSTDFLVDENKDIIERNEIDSIYKFINDNKNDILTKKQIDFLHRLKTGDVNSDEKYYMKKSIIGTLETALNDNRFKYIKNVNYGYENKKDIIEILENILCSDHVASFKRLCKYLKNVQNKSINIIEDIIFSCDPIHYKPIIKYINTYEIEEGYIENYYQLVYEKLKKEYEFQSIHPIKTYEYNLSENEKNDQKTINYIENEIMKGKNEVFIANHINNFFFNKEELLDFLDPIYFKTKLFIGRDKLKKLMNHLGYELKKMSRLVDGQKIMGSVVTRKNIPS